MTVLNADNKKPDDILKNLEYGSLEVTAYPVENMTALPLQKMLTSEDITPEMIEKLKIYNITGGLIWDKFIFRN